MVNGKKIAKRMVFGGLAAVSVLAAAGATKSALDETGAMRNSERLAAACQAFSEMIESEAHYPGSVPYDSLTAQHSECPLPDVLFDIRKYRELTQDEDGWPFRGSWRQFVLDDAGSARQFAGAEQYRSELHRKEARGDGFRAAALYALGGFGTYSALNGAVKKRKA